MTGVATRIERYRQRARELRELAGRLRFWESRARLLGTANGFDRLADELEGREDARAHCGVRDTGTCRERA